MISQWEEVSLKDVCNDISYGYTASATHEDTGVKFLRITDIVPSQLDWNTVPFCEISDKDAEKYKLYIGDIVIARTGATTGYNHTLKSDINAVFASYLIRYKINPKIANPFYVGYNLKSENWKGYVENIIGGSAQPGANAQQFASYEFLLPPLPEQEAIAEVLSSLDDKIDLLHRNNKTLEQLAETLFRQWFIEEADDSWEKDMLGNHITIKRGGSPRPIHDYIVPTGYKWLKISDVSGLNTPYVFDIKESIKESGLNKTVFLKSGSLVLSNSATPGIPKILAVDTCIHDGWLYFPNSIFSIEFMYLLFNYIRPELIQLGNGSIFTNLKTDILKEYVIQIPDGKTLEKFDNLIAPIFNKLLKNTKQIKQLEQLRDTLLPKLMSGEVRVQDIKTTIPA